MLGCFGGFFGSFVGRFVLGGVCFVGFVVLFVCGVEGIEVYVVLLLVCGCCGF